MLKQFIDLKNVLSSSGFICFSFELALAWRFSVSLVVTLMFYCSLQFLVFSCQIKEDKSGNKVEECRKQCHVDFQLETLKYEANSLLNITQMQSLGFFVHSVQLSS